MKNNLTYRPEINGLRAFSIMLVLIYHLFPSYLKSGFIGVDIFFVISGYLIVQILIKDDLNNLSLVGFFKNRFLRLAPALFVVLASILLAGWFILLDDEYLAVSKATLSSLVAQSNFYEYSRSGYFETTVTSRPLLHLWSLAVEIQFYIFISCLIAWQHQSKNFIWLLVIITVGSFALDVVYIHSNSSAVFYFSPFRIWEILVGSLVALIQKDQLFDKKFNYIGALLLLLSVLFINNQIVFPGFITLLPVLGAALVLVKTPVNLVSKALSLKPVVFLGVLSYSLYLWHWPVLDLSKLVYGNLSPLYRITLVPLSVFLAFITTYYIENPIRKGGGFSILVYGFIVILITSLAIYFQGGLHHRHVNIKNHELYNPNNMEMNYRESCRPFTGVINKEDRCNSDWYIKNQTRLAILGDSQSNAFTTVLNAMHAFQTFNYVQFGRGSCPSLLTYGDKQCAQFATDVLSTIEREKSIQKVVIAAQWPLYSEGLKIDGVFYSGDELWDALEKTISRYKIAGKDVYVLYSVPLGAEPRRCFERVPFLSQGCQLDRNLAIYNEKNYREKLNRIVLKYQLKTIDPFDAFCGNEVCKVQDGSKLFYLDGSHMSNEGGRLIASSMNTQLMNGLLNFQ